MVKEKRKICIYCETWESGGIESFLCGVLTHMDLSAFEIDIVAARLRPSIFTEPLQALGIHFIELSGSPRKIAENSRQFRRLLRRRRYDVVHLNIFHGLSMLHLYEAKKIGVPVRIVHAHGSSLRRSRARPAKILLHRICCALFTRDATCCVACSQSAAAFMFGKRRRTEILWNGIDTARFAFDIAARRGLRDTLGLGDRFVLGTVGRLSPEKNQRFLLEVHAAVRRICPDACLLLVGDGEMLGELQEMAQALGTADHVIFYGNSSDVPGLLSTMDVFVLPSLFEGFGISALEAQASGLWTFCSDGVSPATAVSGHCVRLPLSAGVEAWASRIYAVHSDTETRREQPQIPDRFDIANTSRAICRLYSGRSATWPNEGA